MNKEPLSLYIFRIIIHIGLLSFMAMMYWSSLLIEQETKLIQSHLIQLKNDLNALHLTLDKIQVEQSPTSFQSSNDQTGLAFSHVNPALPNLLNEDPFYTTTLPYLLGDQFKPLGTRQEASVARPENLHPFSNVAQVADWWSLCSVSVANQQFGIYETYAPDMAYKMELRQSSEGKPEFWIHLRKEVFWNPLQQDHFTDNIPLAPQFLEKHPVTAHDFKFYWDAIMNPYVQEAGAVALRNYLSDIQELKVVDDWTFIVRWNTKEVIDVNGQVTHQMKYSAKLWTAALKPLPSFVYQHFSDGTKIIEEDHDPHTYQTNPIWAQNFSQHWAKNIIVSCGPWLFDGLTDREIRFRRNALFYEPNAVLVNALEIRFKDSSDTIWEDFKAGTLDLFSVPPNQLAELERFLQSAPYNRQKQSGLEIKRLDYLTRSYTYIGWNMTHPLFQSKKVRQALTMAIDRNRIISQYLNGMGEEITGTFFKYSPSYDPSIIPYPYSLQQARSLLEEEGWYDRNGDGILDRIINGKEIPFVFTLTYYVKNQTTKSICEYIATALKELGVICQTNGVDMADLSAAFDDKSFEAIFLGWALGSPPEDPRQLWYSTGAKEKGSSNAVGFANAEVDGIIDQLDYEFDPQKRVALYHRFDAILYNEAPYTFLYTPKIAFVYRKYLQNVFIPAERQDLIPGANVGEPQSNIFWLKQSSG
jgi:peptide/nickel transport system substrate-binding protein